MADIEPKYFDHPDKCIRYLEWNAIKLVFDGNGKQHHDYFDAYSQSWMYWADHYSAKRSDAHKQIMTASNDGTYRSIDEFYKSISNLLKPKKRGKALKDAKKRTAQKSYQQDKLGDDFIDNNDLISAAKIEAKALCDSQASVDDVQSKAAELASLHTDGEGLSDGQMAVLINLIQRQIDKHMRPNNIEAKIIDADDKNLWFMWGKIKRTYPLGDTFVLPTSAAAKLGGCSKTSVAPVMKELEKLGAITRTQKGARGANSGRAAIYRREV